MIFSTEKWNDAAEIRPFVKVSSALSFATVEASLASTFRLFIAPLLGNELASQLVSIYNKADRSAVESQLLVLAQFCNANLAFWYDFDQINAMVTDVGFRRSETETQKQVFKSHEISLKDGFKNKGFDGVDSLLSFLFSDAEKTSPAFPSFKTSPSYLGMIDSPVRSAAEVDKYYFINGSRLTYMRLLPHIRYTSLVLLADFIPESLLTPEARLTHRETYLPWIVVTAVRRLLIDSGSLTNRGLYFSAVVSNSDNLVESRPADGERLNNLLSQLQADAENYRKWILAKLKASDPDKFESTKNDFNNDGRAIFFAI